MKKFLNIKKKILISSGFNKSHLIGIAGELNNSRKHSIYFISSLYPNLWLRKILLIFSKYNKAIHRLIDRCENIDEDKVYSHPLSELISKISSIFNFKENQFLRNNIESFGMKNYSNYSINILRKVKPEIYHFRSCYGLRSLDYAINNRIINICDHTICHPRFLWQQLNLENTFNYPFRLEKINNEKAKLMNKVFKLMEYDLNKSENILVNSEFVKKTCVFYGLNPNKIKVIYLGCDRKFLSYNHSFKKYRKKRNNFLFVGAWNQRKGVIELSKALIKLDLKITLTIVGASFNEVKNVTPFIFASKIKLNILGYVNRDNLAEIYSSHQILIMPSLAEGSARVGFEALASGCFVITTPFSGTIVKNNLNGYLVDAGNIEQLKIALQNALEMPSNEIEEIMLSNFLLIRKKYTPEKYVEKLNNYYELLEARK